MKQYKKHPVVEISLLKEGDERYFRYLFDAILNVEEKYITYEDLSGHEGKEEHVERVFAYELYRQWANLLEKNNEELVLNGEVYKHLKSKDGESDKNGVYPDLVLHVSQGTGNNQKMICEIKRSKYYDKKKGAEDLVKLGNYLRNDSFIGYPPFNYGIFILAGKEADQENTEELKDIIEVKLDDIKEVVMNTFKENLESEQLDEEIEKYRKTFNRIVCIAYDGNGESLDYDTLDNILGEAETSQ